MHRMARVAGHVVTLQLCLSRVLDLIISRVAYQNDSGDGVENGSIAKHK